MKSLKIILGFILAMTSLWGGSYFLGQIPNDNWAMFPTLVSAGMGIGIGLWVIIDGVV